ncbi:PIN domain-containing protein [Dolichospermum circinale]|uniref:PIN domain-containing protein n=1 Tax=Dolichospermum circinale TaxID=109265 RepID=UPI003A8E91BC
MESPRVKIFTIDEKTSEYYALIYSKLRKKGKPIPTNDIWIAATAIQHNLILFTYDSDFKTHIPHPKMLQREITEMKIKGSIKTNR